MAETKTTNKQPKILSAMHKLMASLKSLPKNRTAPAGRGGRTFSYRGIDDLLDALHPLLVEHKILVLPKCLSRDWQFEAQAGHPWEMAVTMQYVFKSTEDGSEVSVEAPGMGADSNDKCSGKAATSAFKTAMYQTFCVPVSDTSIDSEAYPDPAPSRAEPPDLQKAKDNLVALVKSEAATHGLSDFSDENTIGLIRAAAAAHGFSLPLKTLEECDKVAVVINEMDWQKIKEKEGANVAA